MSIKTFLDGTYTFAFLKYYIILVFPLGFIHCPFPGPGQSV